MCAASPAAARRLGLSCPSKNAAERGARRRVRRTRDCSVIKGASMSLPKRVPVDDQPSTPLFSASLSAAQSRQLRSTSVGSRVVGALAVGAVAMGALAIGALAIGRLAIGRSRIRRLEIDELVVRNLRVTDVLQTPTNPSRSGDDVPLQQL